jgi:hypothetical protein
MLRKLILWTAVVGAASFAAAQDFTGDWQGTLSIAGGELRLVLHVSKAADGTLKGLLDSPDQGAENINVDTIAADGAKLHFAINAIKGNFDGTLKGNGTINGTWSQGTASNKEPLVLTKTATPIKMHHDPAPPSDIDGTWEGTLDMPGQGGKLRLVFHFKNTADGLTATMDSPDQKLKGWPATTVTRKGSSMKVAMAQINGEFSGKIGKGLDTMSGDWTQGGSGIPLLLKKAKDEPAEAPKTDAEKK